MDPPGFRVNAADDDFATPSTGGPATGQGASTKVDLNIVRKKAVTTLSLFRCSISFNPLLTQWDLGVSPIKSLFTTLLMMYFGMSCCSVFWFCFVLNSWMGSGKRA